MTFSILGNGRQRYFFTLLCSPTLTPVSIAEWYAIDNGEVSHPVRFNNTELKGFRWEDDDAAKR